MKATHRLVLVLRLFALTLVAHSSGVVHDVADLVCAVTTGAEAPHDDDDGPGDQDEDCPAGCPNCHCSHSVGSLPQVPTTSVVAVLDECTDVIGALNEAPLHSLTDPRSVYRPPRSTARLS